MGEHLSECGAQQWHRRRPWQRSHGLKYNPQPGMNDECFRVIMCYTTELFGIPGCGDTNFFTTINDILQQRTPQGMEGVEGHPCVPCHRLTLAASLVICIASRTAFASSHLCHRGCCTEEYKTSTPKSTPQINRLGGVR